MNTIPTGAEVTSATFSLYRLGDFIGYDYPATMHISPITESWDPTSATWDNLSQSCGVAVVTKELPSGSLGDVTFDVTALISDIVDGSISDYGFMLSCTTSYTGSSNGQFSYFASSEYVTEDKRPRLNVEYTGTKVMSTSSKLNNLLLVELNNNNVILYSTNKYENCSVALYTMNGELISLQKRALQKGTNTINFSGKLASGCYICKVSARNLNITEKLLLN